MVEYQILATKSKFGDDNFEKALEAIGLKIKCSMPADTDERIIYEVEGAGDLKTKKSIQTLHGVQTFKEI